MFQIIWNERKKLFGTKSKNGYFDLYAIQAPPLLKNGPLPEIDFLDVSDDLEIKKNSVQKIFWLWKFSKKNLFGYSDLYAIQATPPLLKFGPPTEIDFFDVSDDFEQNFFFGTNNFLTSTPYGPSPSSILETPLKSIF